MIPIGYLNIERKYLFSRFINVKNKSYDGTIEAPCFSSWSVGHLCCSPEEQPQAPRASMLKSGQYFFHGGGYGG